MMMFDVHEQLEKEHMNAIEIHYCIPWKMFSFLLSISVHAEEFPTPSSIHTQQHPTHPRWVGPLRKCSGALQRPPSCGNEDFDWNPRCME
jgi:hypothetical protein